MVDHLCRVTLCCYPEHLDPVEQRENVLRGVGLPAAEVQITQCPRGHAYDHDNTYITPSKTRACRACHREWARKYRKTRERAGA